MTQRPSPTQTSSSDLQAQYEDVIEELDELAEVYLEHRAAGKKTEQISTAITQADRESRKLERKIKKHNQ